MRLVDRQYSKIGECLRVLSNQEKIKRPKITVSHYNRAMQCSFLAGRTAYKVNRP